MWKKYKPKHLKEKSAKSKKIEKVKIVDETKKDVTPVLVTDNLSDENIYEDNTLLISALKGKVFLPFKKSDLENILNECNNKYSSIQDIINSNYTLPLNLFKSSSISRFREAFKLMYNKEKSSIKDALDLGFEVMLNYNLHPAIISACKNIDELDIYLDYLESGEPQKFDCFNIIFEFPPMVIK